MDFIKIFGTPLGLAGLGLSNLDDQSPGFQPLPGTGNLPSDPSLPGILDTPHTVGG